MNYSLLQGRARVPGGVNIPSPAIQTIETVAKNDQAEWKKHLQPKVSSLYNPTAMVLLSAVCNVCVRSL